jgi:dipeptidyl aminopeptidase/acylaminoacyl peptidase
MPASIVLHRATGDGASVFMTATDDKQRQCLYEYTSMAGFKERACGNFTRSPIFGFDGETLLGFFRERDGLPANEYLDPQHPDARTRRSLEKAFSGQHVSVVNQALDGSRLLIYVSSDRNPGEYYLVDRGTMKVNYLISSRSWVDPASMSPSTPFTYHTRDGVSIAGYLTARGGTKARKLPLVVMPHGGPHGVRDYWGWDGDAQLLASRNYAVLQVNFRGSGGFGDAFEAAGYGKWGTLMQDDLTDAVRWAVEQGIADPQKVCILGYSYGAYAGLMSSIREPGLYRCAVLFAGPYDLNLQATDSAAAESALGRATLERYLGDETVRGEHSPITRLDALVAPVLIAHGTADSVVPFSQAKRLREALRDRRKIFEWIEFSGEEHGFHQDANREKFLGAAMDFLDKHIGPNAAPQAAAAATQTQ